ncbi:hypothetical protein, partial [Bradyrhizobium pachyrhizi]|uniref:hypothetical protein n=1 Tax=Bradyrhizobium pachyrhizi TaxID=280333 RepID=UPI001AEBC0A5
SKTQGPITTVINCLRNGRRGKTSFAAAYGSRPAPGRRDQPKAFQKENGRDEPGHRALKLLTSRSLLLRRRHLVVGGLRRVLGGIGRR